jgi:hypothetical protein
MSEEPPKLKDSTIVVSREVKDILDQIENLLPRTNSGDIRGYISTKLGEGLSVLHNELCEVCLDKPDSTQRTSVNMFFRMLPKKYKSKKIGGYMCLRTGSLFPRLRKCLESNSTVNLQELNEQYLREKKIASENAKRKKVWSTIQVSNEISDGNLENVRDLLKDLVYPFDVHDLGGMTLVCRAVDCNQKDIVEFLIIEKNACIVTHNRDGTSVADYIQDSDMFRLLKKLRPYSLSDPVDQISNIVDELNINENDERRLRSAIDNLRLFF